MWHDGAAHASPFRLRQEDLRPYMEAMKALIAALALLLVTAPLAAQEATAGAPADPVARWRAAPEAPLDGTQVEPGAFEYVARPFVIFADSPLQPELAEQLRLLEADAQGLARRDVAVIVDSDPEAQGALRRALRPRGFGVVLLGKDGGVVLRRPAPLSAREVARAVDRTPARQEELRLGQP